MKLSHYVLSGVLAASLSITSSAQVAPATPATNDKSSTEDVVIMNPFQVSSAGDVGYVAGNAISATRINTPLNDLPFSITAFTPQFIADTGAESLLDVVSQSAGVKSGISNNTQGNAAFSVRGFVQSPQRDGFSSNALTSNYVAAPVIERVEVVKGPASLLYGAIAPGGTVNYITKSALERPSAESHVMLGSYNYYGAVFDENQPLIPGSLLFRIVASYENNEQYYQNVQGHTEVVFPVFKWIISPKATLSLSYQVYHSRETPPAMYRANSDLATPSSIVNALYGAGHPAGGSLLANKTGPAVALGVSDVSDPGFMGAFPAMPNTFNISDINDTRINDLRALNAEFNVKINDQWDARAHIGSDKDYMTFAETGHATLFVPPPDTLVYSGGVWSVAPRWTAMTTAQQIAEGLAFAQQAVKNWGLLVSSQNGTPTPALIDRAPRVQEQWMQGTTYQTEAVGVFSHPAYKLQVLGGLFYDRVRFNLRTTQNRGNAASPFFQDWDINPHSPTYYADYDEGKFSGNTLSVINTYTTTINSDYAAYGLLNASFLQNRLILVAGARYNVSASRVFDHTNQTFSQGLRAAHTTPQAGFGFKVTPNVMVYGSYSESYTLSTQPYLTVPGVVSGIPTALPSTPTSPTIGKGTEVGFKMELLDNTLHVTLAAYRIEQDNVLQALNQNINGTGVVLWNQGAKQRANGAEATLNWAPRRNLQIVFNAAEEDARNIAEPFGLDYYLGQNVGYTAKTMANLWTRYDLTSDAFKGLWIGGGLNYVGRSAGDPRNVAYYLPAYTLYNTAIGIDWTWNNHKISTILNLKNMGNTEYKASPNSVGEPRRFLLSSTMKF
jgi:iron complex outermembrane receptor protein